MNNKTLLCITLILAGYSAVHAQKLSVMPMVGFGAATVGFTAYGGHKPALGKEVIWKTQAGFLISKQISGPFSLSLGAGYVQKGYRARYVPPIFSYGSSVSYKHEFDYLEIPALARVTIGKSATRFFFHAGPYAAYLVKYTSDDARLNRENKPALNNPFFNRWDFGIYAGMGLQIKAGAGDLVFEARYTQGFRNANNKSEEFGLRNAGSHNLTSILVGYAIPIGNQ